MHPRSTAWLLAVLAAAADDAGPGREVRAIRHDLPILVGAQARPPRLQIDGVVVSGDDALAQWESEESTFIAFLHERFGRWWITRISVSASSSSHWPRHT
jgi:hypothetical protein